MNCKTKSVILFVASLVVLLGARVSFAAPKPMKVHQPAYKFDFDVYRTEDMPANWYKTYDNYYVTKGMDGNWVYGKQSTQGMAITNILVGSVNPAQVTELNSIATPQPVYIPQNPNLSGSASVTAKEEKNVSGPILIPPQKINTKRSSGKVPSKDKVAFAESIYNTLISALKIGTTRAAYSKYGEPSLIYEHYYSSVICDEIPLPGGTGKHIAWFKANKRIIPTGHVNISVYGNKIFAAGTWDQGYGDIIMRNMNMDAFWKWYDERVELFSYIFNSVPIYENETAMWFVDNKYLFLLLPIVTEGRKNNKGWNSVTEKMLAYSLSPASENMLKLIQTSQIAEAVGALKESQEPEGSGK